MVRLSIVMDQLKQCFSCFGLWSEFERNLIGLCTVPESLNIGNTVDRKVYLDSQLFRLNLFYRFFTFFFRLRLRASFSEVTLDSSIVYFRDLIGKHSLSEVI